MLFSLCIYVLFARKKLGYQLHLWSMITLFVLSTVHITLEYGLAFKYPIMLQGPDPRPLYTFILRDTPVSPSECYSRVPQAMLLAYKSTFIISK